MKNMLKYFLILITLSWSHIANNSTPKKITYERYSAQGKWISIPEAEGKELMALLKDFESFKNWGHDIPKNIFAQPIPTIVEFRMREPGGNVQSFDFSRRAELVGRKYTLKNVPKNIKDKISRILSNWEKRDEHKISSQKLPIKYRVGSINDGGTLWGVAKLFYGDGRKWKQIFEANKATLKSPQELRNGLVIIIPKI